MTHHVDLDTITLDRGSHPDATPGKWCVMEAAAYFANERWSDRPQCVSPVIGAFLRRWNDDLDDEGRQKLVPLIPKVVGTNTGMADEERRAWMVTDWMVRTYMPAWLDLAGMAEQATAVRSLSALDGAAAWKAMAPTVQKARSDAAAARAAAWAAAGAAAWAAARAALRPTAEGLQESALRLLDDLIAVGAEVPA